MRSLKISLALGFVLLIAGCIVSSLYPLFTEKDLVFDPSLLGTWVGQNEDDTLLFQDGGEKAYDLTYISEGQGLKFEVHLVKLGELKFFDVYPQLDKEHDAYHLIPAHTIWRVQKDQDIIRVAWLDQSWVKEKIAKKEIVIPHQLVEDRIILTASTEELQKFVLKYADEAFSDFNEFKLQK